ncbi:MAG: hypothetical protein WC438_05210 [Candidatus Pacearchaeota archaeon]
MTDYSKICKYCIGDKCIDGSSCIYKGLSEEHRTKLMKEQCMYKRTLDTILDKPSELVAYSIPG